MKTIDPPLLVDLVGQPEATIDGVLRARLAATPESVFLRWEDRVWTYREAIAEEAAGFAIWVDDALGGRPAAERRVVSFLPNRPEAIWTWFGSLLSGSVYTALNRSHRGQILRDMLVRSRARVLVTDAAGYEVLPDLDGTRLEKIVVVGAEGPPSPVNDGIETLTWDETRSPVDALPPEPAWGPGDVAQTLFTSGSTGRSKAVMINHTQMVRGAAWVGQAIDMTADDVVHTWLPLFHVGGQLDAVLMAVLAGAQVALFATFSRSRFWDQVESSGSTVFIAFENLLRILLTLPPKGSDRECSLRVGITGGVPREIRPAFEERFGLRLAEAYGMTEAEPIALQYADCPPESVGRPASDFEVAILGPDDQMLEQGQQGEIAIRPRRAHVMFSGYEDDPEVTVANTRTLWYHTGDLGSFDADGNLYFHGRLKHFIRRRGENISPWELESVINKHPEVSDCVAVGIASELGEDDVKVIVSLAAGSALEPSALWEWSKGRLAAFMVPRYIEVAETVPRFDTGKPDMTAARESSDAIWDADRAR